MDKLQQAEGAIKATQDLIPIVSKDPLAAALVIVSVLAFLIAAVAAATLWYMGRHVLKLSRSLDQQVTINVGQGKTLDGLFSHVQHQVRHMARIREIVAVIAERLHIRGRDLPAPDEEG